MLTIEVLMTETDAYIMLSEIVLINIPVFSKHSSAEKMPHTINPINETLCSLNRHVL